MSRTLLRNTCSALTVLVVLSACTRGTTLDPNTDPTNNSGSATESETPAPSNPTTDPEEDATAQVHAVFEAYTLAYTAALREGPTPPVLVEHLEGLATGSWIIELQNGFGPNPPPVKNPPTHGVLTIVDLDVEAGTATGSSCYGPVRVGDSSRRVVKHVEVVREEDGTWLVAADRADGESSCDE